MAVIAAAICFLVGYSKAGQQETVTVYDPEFEQTTETAEPDSLIIEEAVEVENAEPMPLPADLRQALVDIVSDSYYEWESISLSGKLSMSGLPVTPTVKIYMEYGSLVIISVSAPFYGEVVRLEMDKKYVLAVNKMKNTYCAYPMSEIDKVCPGGLVAFQNLLLGRVSLIGSGELTPASASEVEVYPYGASWLLLPNQDLETSECVYYYIINGNDFRLDRFSVVNQKGVTLGECNYTWGTDNYTLDLMGGMPGRYMGMTLRLNAPELNARKIARIQLGSKYKRVTPKELMKW